MRKSGDDSLGEDRVVGGRKWEVGGGKKGVGSGEWGVGSGRGEGRGVLPGMDFLFTVKISNSKEIYIWNTAGFPVRVR